MAVGLGKPGLMHVLMRENTFKLSSLALEVTSWRTKELDDEFLGEILLDLGEAKINNSVNCYNLEDHDDNSSPLSLR